ncbi:virulence factor Mce-like protein [Rhodococcus sp. 27YEA15]|uniref:MCE family protein n=1 Tax=Rhodococcus sp. 27YEA15 TaxID=3156259 RepID=UPI003C7B32C4
MNVSGVGRSSLVLRGLLAVVVLLGAYVFLFSRGVENHGSTSEVTVVVPAAAGALKTGSSVQYRGVVVGSVAAINAGTTSSDVSLSIDRDSFADIPSTSQVRLMPRNIFGDFFVDLIQPDGLSRGPSLTPGTRLSADQSSESVQLYQAISRIYTLVTSLDPADLNAALTAISTALSGKGTKVGNSLDSIDRALVGAQPVIDGLGNDLDDVAALAGSLSLSAPDLLATLKNSITTSTTVTDKASGVAALLQAGTRTGAAAADVVGENQRSNHHHRR